MGKQAQGAATQAAVAKKKKKIHVDVNGKVFVKATFNNVIVTITDTYGNTIAWSSAGVLGCTALALAAVRAGKLAGLARNVTTLDDDTTQAAVRFLDSIPRARDLLKLAESNGVRIVPVIMEAIARSLREKIWPLIESGRIKPVVYKTFPLAEAAARYAGMSPRRLVIWTMTAAGMLAGMAGATDLLGVTRADDLRHDALNRARRNREADTCGRAALGEDRRRRASAPSRPRRRRTRWL